MNTEATLLTGKVETPKRALALKLVLAICALTALVVEARAAATRRKSSPAAALIGRKRAEASECAECPLLSSRF